MLTERQREVVYMRYRADLSFREIGRLLGIDHSAVWCHNARALVKLRSQVVNARSSISRRPDAQT